MARTKSKDAFILSRPKARYTTSNSPVVKITAESYNLLVDMTNESCLPLSHIASKAIQYAYDHLEFEERSDINE